MKKITLCLFMGLMGSFLFAQCPLPSTAFVGDYNLVQTTPDHPENGGPSFNDQVVSLSVGSGPNNRVFSAVYLEFLTIGQPAMDVSFTLDCANGSDVIVDPGLNTNLTCDLNLPDGITMGSATITGTFDVNDDSSFTLIVAEYVTDGGCGVAQLETTFTLTKANCATPQNVAVNNITSTSADVSWTDTNGSGTTFDVEYGAEGFTPGSGTVISGVTATSTTLTGLQIGTFYDVYVNSNCGADTSIFAGPINFLVPADCATEFSGFPLTENFDNVAVFASCYTIIDEDSNGIAWIQQELELQPLTTSFFATNGTNDATKEDYLFSPAISLTAGNTYDISLSYNGADAQNGSANENLEVLVAQGNTVADANAGTSIFTDTGIVQNGTFDNVENQALTGTGQFTPSTSGDYYLVFKSTGSPAPLAQTTGFLLIFNYSVDETLSTQEFEAFNFNYFVDAQNNLNLSSNQAFDQIKLHNLLGQQVLNQKLSAQDERIDLNALTSGVYLAQVQINDATKTFKIIKK
ncbi:T9SS-dependent choice-of-anchor J family protein [Flavobacterium sp. CS20]|uniref:T9SS-dependent choice-of-anchor J family protein n=1 Tax=Flavobacterium sp. CS20 TaxID=2775246 RepID=UPI001B39CDE7|nr:T9SS type A sorting domain-containing protein [Flavobacterium sp. CS20]QTY26295.1 T9SS type A sorting domain-containing protein [Flavobacterium sp. CS20]